MEWNNDELDDGFNTTIREFVIFFLLFIVLQFLSFGLISVYRKRFTIYSTDHEDVIVYRVSFWACSFSVSLAIGAVLLLPISIMSNEVLLYYPKSYFFRWLNISLIQGLWNSTFLLSNFALFILLPFAYFFSESQGFSGSCYKGIKGRIYETFSVLLLVGLLMSSLLCILCAIFEYPRNSLVPIFDLWSDYLPFVYSCVSFVGVLMLLVCTPVGFAHLFTVIGKLVSSEDLTRSIQTDISMLQCERANILVKINGFENVKVPHNFKEEHLLLQDLTSIDKQLEELQSSLRATKFRRTLGYPIAMLLLLAFTIISVLMVAQNILALCFGIKTLPIYSKNVSLGISSLSALGPLGALFEIILILYLWCSSVVGLYALPMFRNLKPKLRETPMTHMMGNSVVLLVLSSALPVLARTVGITNFDLLGDFGRIHWLGNMNIVMFYNVVFAGATATCLGTKITATMRQELLAIVRSAAIFRDSPPRICTLPTDPCTDRYLLKRK